MPNTDFKIGYLFFRDLFNNLPEEFSFELDENIIFSKKMINVEDKIWKEWLGLKWNEVKGSNAMIKLEIPTKIPEVLDGENSRISELINKVYIALQLEGDFKIEVTNFFTGSRIGEEIKFRQWVEYGNWYASSNFRKIEERDMELWSKLFKRIRFLYSRLANHEFLRFNRGLLNFQQGCGEQWLDFRLPYFVRSLEALILPDKSHTKKQFKKRVARWVPASYRGNPEEILGEIYDLRCDCEHLHGLREEYSESSLLRANQCEEIARNAYQAILINGEDLENFTTDSKIKDYWKKLSNE